MITLRKAIKNDHIILANVFMSNKVLYDPIMPGIFERQANKFLEQGMPYKYEVRIIRSLDKDVGFLGTKQLSKSTCYLLALYLHHSYHGQRIGLQTLDLLKSDCLRNGTKEIILLVHNKATWAKGFYSKYGFKLMGTTEEKIRQYNGNIIGDNYLNHTELMVLAIDS